VAAWGEAQLIKYLDGKTELRGGSDQDRAEAREWMSLFWHEGVVSRNQFSASGPASEASSAPFVGFHRK
jgi:hypothetical protein